MINEELKTFLIVKYGSLDRMYNRWLISDIELSEEERVILVEHKNEDYADMLVARLKFKRAMHGVFS